MISRKLYAILKYLLRVRIIVTKYKSSKTALHNLRLARSFSVALNVAKARPQIINRPFRISSALQGNILLRPTANLC